MRTDAIRRQRNRALRSALRKAIRAYRAMALEERAGAYASIQSRLDRAVTKGVITRNQAARLKSRLAPPAA